MAAACIWPPNGAAPGSISSIRERASRPMRRRRSASAPLWQRRAPTCISPITPTRTTPTSRWLRSKSERPGTRTRTWSAPTRSAATCRSPRNAPASAPYGRNRSSARTPRSLHDWHRPEDSAGSVAASMQPRPMLNCIVANFLNRSCAFAARFESILLRASAQNPFPTASARNGIEQGMDEPALIVVDYAASRASRENPGSPNGKRPRKWRAPRWQGFARTLVAACGLQAAASELDAALRFPAQEDYKLRALAGFRAQLLVGDDQGRPWRRFPRDTVQCVLRNGDSVKCCFRADWVRRHRFVDSPTASTRGAVRLGHAVI